MKPSFPAYFSNLEGFALFHPQERMSKFEYKRPTQFSRFHTIVPGSVFSKLHKISGFPGVLSFFKVLQIQWEP